MVDVWGIRLIPEIIGTSFVFGVRITGTYVVASTRGRTAVMAVLIGVHSHTIILRADKVGIYITEIWSSIFTIIIGCYGAADLISVMDTRMDRTSVAYAVLRIWTGIWAWSVVKVVIGRIVIASQRNELVHDWRLDSMTSLKAGVVFKAKNIFGQAIQESRRVYRTVTVSRIWRRFAVVIRDDLFKVSIGA